MVNLIPFKWTPYNLEATISNGKFVLIQNLEWKLTREAIKGNQAKDVPQSQGKSNSHTSWCSPVSAPLSVAR